MGRAADASELRCLLLLADRLRQVAVGPLGHNDRALYLLTADALEKYSALAAGAPDNRITPDDPRFYRSVDITI